MSKTIVTAAVAILAASGISPARAIAEPYRVCGHVPITGAAPIPHHEDRFGQFYFDYVNTELGGVDGHPVEFKMVDDRYFPGGAREALETCRRTGAQLLIGPWGHDQMVAGARWAETNHIPYLHGSLGASDVEHMTWSAFLSATDDALMRGLARTMVSDAPEDAVFGLVQIDSRYYDTGRSAFSEALEELGFTLSEVVKVQKDEKQFDRTWRELQGAGVTHVVLHVSGIVALHMLSQKPFLYDPRFGSIEPMVSSEVVASSIPDGVRFLAFHDPGPPFEWGDFERTDLPWSDEIAEFERIFSRYSPEQNPPPSSFDWDSYLRAKQIHRFLDALDENLSPAHIRSMFSSYRDADDPTLTCALDFAREPGVGSHEWQTFEFDQGRWQLRDTCTSAQGLDFGGLEILCADELPLATGVLRCRLRDPISGIRGASAVELSVPFESDVSIGFVSPDCPARAKFTLDLEPGVHRIQIGATDCAGNDSTLTTIVVAV